MRTPRTLLLPLVALPLAGCALLPTPAAEPPDPGAPGPRASTGSVPEEDGVGDVSDEDVLLLAFDDYEAYLTASGAVATGRADAAVLQPHLAPNLMAGETALFEQLHAAGLTYSDEPTLGDARGAVVERSERWIHVQLEVCVEGEHVALGDSGRTFGRLEQTVDLVASPETDWVFIVGRFADGTASPVCR